MPARPRNRLRAWLFLVLALSAVVLFAVVLGPGLRRLPGIRSVTGRTEAGDFEVVYRALAEEGEYITLIYGVLDHRP